MENRWIWPFELLDKLGEGGMGVVYRARYVGNNRIVAVKLVPDEVAANPTLLARFERELDVLKQLRHPHIVHCFGGTCESKQRFYAMEIVDGGTLHSLLRDVGKLPWETAVEYALQMCAALQYAHERNVIHRDVKPGNFLITKAGKLKLSDFGLAIVVASQRITAAGKTMGTFHYMAPEQIRGKPPVTNRTDLYALGCVIYEMLTGNPPFDADHAAEVLHMHLKETPPHVAQSVTDCPHDLDQLVANLLEKDPEQRPADAGVVSERLKAILESPSGTAISFSPTPSAMRALLPEEPVAPPPPPPTTAMVFLQWPFWAVVSVSLLIVFWNAGLRSHNNSLQQRITKSDQVWQDFLNSGDDTRKIATLKETAKLETLPPPLQKFLLDGLDSENRFVRLEAVKAIGVPRRERLTAATVKLFTMQSREADEEIKEEISLALKKAPLPPEKPPERSLIFSWGIPLFACLVLAAFAGYLWLWWIGHPFASSA